MSIATDGQPSPVMISIVINNFNYARYLTDAIDSALEQSHPSVEIIVVDDGSTDSSRSVIASYGRRVKGILKANGGQASCFNVGIRAAKGEVVLFLDADDRLRPMAAARIAEGWKREYAMGYYMLDCISDSGTPTNGHFPLPSAGWDEGQDAWQRILERGSVMFPPTSGNFFSAWALRKIASVPEAEYRIRADVYLHHTVPFEGPVLALREALGEYRIHGNNSWYGPRKEGLAHLMEHFDLNALRKSSFRRSQKLDLLRRAALNKGRELGEESAVVVARERIAKFILSRFDPSAQLSGGREPSGAACLQFIVFARNVSVKVRVQLTASILFHLCLPMWILRKLYRASNFAV